MSLSLETLSLKTREDWRFRKVEKF
jgi:hypothetical protein